MQITSLFDNNEKISVYTEDAEAIWFFKKLYLLKTSQLLIELILSKLIILILNYLNIGEKILNIFLRLSLFWMVM